MGRIGVLALIFGVSVLFTCSDASRSWNPRSLMVDGSKEEKAVPQKVSPPPGPVQKNDDSGSTEKPQPALQPPPLPSASPPLSSSPVLNTDKANPESPINHSPSPPPPLDSGNSGTEKPNNLPHPPPSPKDKVPVALNAPEGVKHEEGGKAGDKDPSESPKESIGPVDGAQLKCDESAAICRRADFMACLQYSGKESMESFVLVRNVGESVLTGNISASPSVSIGDDQFTVNKHDSWKIPFSTSGSESTKIVIKTDKENCTLHTSVPVSDWNLTDQLVACATQLTPVYGAYFLFITLFIAGGTWACCKFGKKQKRTDAGIPYQQVEMGTRHESTSAVVDAATTDGWNEGWDDDWDDEEAASRPPEKQPAENALMNGHASRTTNKEGWDDDWDD